MPSLSPLILAALHAAPTHWVPGEVILLQELGLGGKVRVPSVIEGVALESGWLPAYGHFLMRESSLDWSVLKVTGQGHAAVVLEQGLAPRPVPLHQKFLQTQLLLSRGQGVCSVLFSLSLSFLLPQLFLFTFPPLPLAHLLPSFAYQHTSPHHQEEGAALALRSSPCPTFVCKDERTDDVGQGDKSFIGDELTSGEGTHPIHVRSRYSSGRGKRGGSKFAPSPPACPLSISSMSLLLPHHLNSTAQVWPTVTPRSPPQHASMQSKRSL